MEDMKYMPMISERKRTTLVVEPLPTLETAKKNFITFAKKPRTDMTTNIPMNIKDMYCKYKVEAAQGQNLNEYTTRTGQR